MLIGMVKRYMVYTPQITFNILSLYTAVERFDIRTIGSMENFEQRNV
jgi:hypothetical protein